MLKKITQFKRENGVTTPKNPTLRNPLRKYGYTKHTRKLMRERTSKMIIAQYGI